MPKIQRNTTVEPTKASLEAQLAPFSYLLAGNLDDDNIEIELPRDEAIDVVDENKPVVGFKQTADMSTFSDATDRIKTMLDNNVEPIVLVGEESFAITPTKQDARIVKEDAGTDVGELLTGIGTGAATGAATGVAFGGIGAGIGAVAGGALGAFSGTTKKKKTKRGLGVYSKQVFVRKTPNIFPMLDAAGLPKYSAFFTANRNADTSQDLIVSFSDLDYGPDFIAIDVEVTMPAVAADEYAYVDVIVEFLCEIKP